MTTHRWTDRQTHLSNFCLATTVDSPTDWLPHQSRGEDGLDNKLRMVVICRLLHRHLICSYTPVLVRYLVTSYLQGTKLNIVLLATAGPGDGIEDTVVWPEGDGAGQ